MSKLNPRQLGLSEEDLAALGYSVRDSAAIGADLAPAVLPTLGAGEPGSGPPSGRPEKISGGGLRWFWTAGLLLLAAWAAGTGRQTTATVAANQPDTVFSSARAMAQLVDIARAPRAPGSAEHARVSAVLRQRLEGLGLEVLAPEKSSLRWSATDSAGATIDAMMADNVVSRLKGSASTGTVLVTAHYDTRLLSPGAGDGALGVAATLEALRALGAGSLLRNDVVVLLADGESLGGLGLQAFVEEHPWMADVRYSVSLEHTGASGASWVVSAPGQRGLLDHVRDPVSASFSVDLPQALSAGPARARLGELGIPGIVLGTIGGRGWSGSALDAPIRVDERTLSHHGAQLLSVLRRVGGEDLASSESDEGADELRTPVTGVGVVAYPMSWSFGITAAIVLAWLTFVVLLRRTGVRMRDVCVGAALGLAMVGAAGGVVHVLTRFLASQHPEFGRAAGGLYATEPHLGALMAAVAAVVALLYAMGRLRFGRTELAAGALVVPVGVLLWTGIVAPSSVVTLQLGLAMALLQLVALTLLGWTRPKGLPSWIVMLVSSIVILAILVPSGEWTGAALWPDSDWLWGGLVGTGLLLLLPALDVMLEPRAWLTPLLAGLASVALLMIGLPSLQGADRHPELTSLVLLIDDAGVASVNTGEEDSAAGLAALEPAASTLEPAASTLEPTDSLLQPVDSMVAHETVTKRPSRHVDGTWLILTGPGESWSRSWAVGGRTTGREPSGMLLPFDDGWTVAGAGPGAELSPPRVEVVRVEPDGTGHRVVVDIHTGLGGLMTGVRLPDDVPGTIVSVQGTHLEGTTGPRALRWWGPTPLRVAFEVSSGGGDAAIDVIEHHMEPRAILGPDFFVRDRSVIPDTRTGSDRIVQRTRFEVPLPGG